MSYESIATAEGVNILLPQYVDPERIGINMGLLGRVARIGGFTGGVTIGTHDGERTKFETSIAGFNADEGTATAGATRTVEASLSESEFAPDERLNDWSHNPWHSRPALHISINTNELDFRVRQTGRDRDVRVWSGLINKAVGRELRAATWRHYMGDFRRSELPIPLTTAVLMGAFAAMTSTIYAEGSAAANIWDAWTLAGYFSVVGPVRARFRAQQTGEPFRDSCFSVIPGVHPDLMAVVWARSHLQKIIKPIEPRVVQQELAA